MSPASSSGGSPKVRFARVFSESDEIKILKALRKIMKKSSQPATPTIDYAILDCLAEKFSHRFTHSQIKDKLRRLRLKYSKQVGRKYLIRTPHDKRVFKIAKRIWAKKNGLEAMTNEADVEGGEKNWGTEEKEVGDEERNQDVDEEEVVREEGNVAMEEERAAGDEERNQGVDEDEMVGEEGNVAVEEERVAGDEERNQGVDEEEVVGEEGNAAVKEQGVAGEEGNVESVGKEQMGAEERNESLGKEDLRGEKGKGKERVGSEKKNVAVDWERYPYLLGELSKLFAGNVAWKLGLSSVQESTLRLMNQQWMAMKIQEAEVEAKRAEFVQLLTKEIMERAIPSVADDVE